ncbi:MAG: cytochrome c [Gammaproteobacteria bacterium]|nr:cytochrome c [Gammaproteobacteria bacterium]
MKRGRWSQGLVAGLAILGVAAVASEGEVDYRQHTMSAVGGHMQAIVDIIQGKVPHTEHMAAHAGALADLADLAGTLFPASSQGGDALPAIWEDGEDFQSKLAAFKEAAANFKTAAGSGDMGQIGGALQQLGQACKGCHDNYRAS